MGSIENQMKNFAEHGYILLGSCVDRPLCSTLHSQIKEDQLFSPDIFIEEESFVKSPQYKNVNPKTNRNKLEGYSDLTSQIEATPAIVETLQTLLGKDYEILNKKVICGVPEKWIPQWILERIQRNPVNNLGAYIRPEYRNVTYFYGIDFHQDIIDWASRDPDFITLYIYLHDVDKASAPLNLLPDTHKLGVDKFPHKLVISNEPHRSVWEFQNQIGGGRINAEQVNITGPTGTVALWHSYTLHGTMPNCGSHERISLRYLISKGKNSPSAFIDSVNGRINPAKFEKDMRLDLDEAGKNKLKYNHLFEQYERKNKN